MNLINKVNTLPLALLEKAGWFQETLSIETCRGARLAPLAFVGRYEPFVGLNPVIL